QPFDSPLLTLPAALTPTNVISATATRLSNGDTSKFSFSSGPFVVTNTNDDGPGSLRQAILNANAVLGLNTITFAIPSAGTQIITVGPPLLRAITDEATIDGTTQPGYVDKPLIEINGVGAGAGASGLVIGGGNLPNAGSSIRALSIYGFDQ